METFDAALTHVGVDVKKEGRVRRPAVGVWHVPMRLHARASNRVPPDPFGEHCRESGRAPRDRAPSARLIT